MLQRLRNYFAPEACAKRQQDKAIRRLKAEGLRLRSERRGIVAIRVLGYSREVEIEKRLRELRTADAPKFAGERRAPRPIQIVEDDACLNESWLHGVASEVRQ